LASDAKIREESAVLANSRSESTVVAPKTPQKQTFIGAAPPTPQTRTRELETIAAKHPAPATEESFEWSSSDDEKLLQAEQEILERTPFETPKKAPRTATITSPGKRSLARPTAQTGGSDEIWPLSDDVFTTPSTSHQSRDTGLRSPSMTPANRHTQTNNGPPETETSQLAAEALKILRTSTSQLSTQAENDLVELLNKHDLRTQGIAKGRDITRLAVHAKDKKIAELQSRIEALEAEKETNRRVITHLKMDMADSPKKGTSRRNIPPARRSEV
jgi:hypothetical protein